MSKLYRIWRFSFFSMIKKPSFIITTLIMNILIVLLISAPTIIKSLEHKQNKENNIYLINDYNNILPEAIFQNSKFILIHDQEDIEKYVQLDNYAGELKINTITNFEFNPKNSNSYSNKTLVDISNLIKNYIQIEYLSKQVPNIPKSEITDILSINVSYSVKDSNISNAKSLILTLSLMIMFLMITCYCQSIAKSLIKEKNKKVTEILFTLADGKTIIFGKVLGYILSILLQLTTFFITFTICITVIKNDFVENLQNMVNITLENLFILLLIYILSFVFYSFLYVAFCSMIKKSDDIENSLMPIGIIVTLIFFIILYLINNSNDYLLTIMSFIPFTTFGALPVKIMSGTISNINIIISLVLLIFSIIIVGILSANIYKYSLNIRGMDVRNIIGIRRRNDKNHSAN